MKNKNYRLDENVLSITTECGDYKFKIDSDTGLANAERIAKIMVEEMARVDNAFNAGREKSRPYAKLMLSCLNICDKYVQIENKYQQLIDDHKRLATIYQGHAGQTSDHEEGKSWRKAAHTTAGHNPALDKSAPVSEVSGIKRKPKPETQIHAAGSEENAHSKPATDDVDTNNSDTDCENKNNPVQPAPLVRQVLEKLNDPQLSAENSTDDTPDTQPGTHTATIQDQKEDRGPQLKINTAHRRRNIAQTADGAQDSFILPSPKFLKTSDIQMEVDYEAIRRDAELLENKLGYFGIKGEVMEVSPGPVITTFEYKPEPGIKISKIVNLADDLALALSALSIRIVAPIPGKDVIGIEIPNPSMSVVPFSDIVNSREFVEIDSPTPICLGKDIIGNPMVVGLEKMPHLLIAGATGTGKSVALNAMITSILYKSSPDRVKFIMIDPKRIELSLFNEIPHLITPVITDMKKANIALQWVVREMERRYEMLARLQVRNIEQYNHSIRHKDLSAYGDDNEFESFPYIVVIIDELADLMMTASKDIEFSLTRIAQMARAAGIHLILATQRPSVDVLTGIIKANFPTRISFQVSSKTDSRTIIDANGAETLLGRGDMLFVPPGTARLTRVHGTFLSEEELISITDFIKAQGKPQYLLEVITEQEEAPAVEISEDDYDEKYQAALDFVTTTRQASISGVQRALRIGYNRAARIIDLMEKKGIVGPSDGVKPRQVLVGRME